MRKKRGNTRKKTENGQDRAPKKPNSPYSPITFFHFSAISEKGKFLKALFVDAHKEAENFAFM